MATVISNGFDGGPPIFISANELREAVQSEFLSQEEARTVYWSQFDRLRRQAAEQAASQPPPLVAAA